MTFFASISSCTSCHTSPVILSLIAKSITSFIDSISCRLLRYISNNPATLAETKNAMPKSWYKSGRTNPIYGSDRPTLREERITNSNPSSKEIVRLSVTASGVVRLEVDIIDQVRLDIGGLYHGDDFGFCSKVDRPKSRRSSSEKSFSAPDTQALRKSRYGPRNGVGCCSARPRIPSKVLGQCGVALGAGS